MNSPEATALPNPVSHFLAKAFLTGPLKAGEGEDFPKPPPPPLTQTPLGLQTQHLPWAEAEAEAVPQGWVPIRMTKQLSCTRLSNL